MKCIAILGPTASGKTALSIELALRFSAYILSLDSLSIYKQIDIASAKPSLHERKGIIHFGIDELYPNEHFDVTMFFDLYQRAFAEAKEHKKNLIIVGGTGFYLKAMMEGLSLRPEISLHVKEIVAQKLIDLDVAYAQICLIDPLYAQKIASSDRYRIEKWLEIFIATNEQPSTYLARAKQAPILGNIPLFEIETPKDILEQRIAKRTHIMLEQGLIDEIFGLEKLYSRAPQCMKAIGIKEVLDYFDGGHTLASLEEKITINTLHLAKRQRTFNTSQFPPHPKMELGALEKTIIKTLEKL